ncbi:hypothetical protein [Clostridium cochlearium]|uniref:hypothetical protein n=1 Tax=Clostridium cochlearium TaxID=1494 RepID=UPI001839CF68|nr:hypothetical protein [Clostridium cochlearium]NMA58234.1 hypothetical protein [Clostridium cochlearium]
MKGKKNKRMEFLKDKLTDLRELKAIGTMGFKIGKEELTIINQEIKDVCKQLYGNKNLGFRI